MLPVLGSGAVDSPLRYLWCFLPRQQLAQNVLQDAAVFVVGHFLWRINTHRRHKLNTHTIFTVCADRYMFAIGKVDVYRRL